MTLAPDTDDRQSAKSDFSKIEDKSAEKQVEKTAIKKERKNGKQNQKSSDTDF